MGKEYALSFSICLQYKVEVQFSHLNSGGSSDFSHKSSSKDGSSRITQKYWLMSTDILVPSSGLLFFMLHVATKITFNLT